ncbi:MAG TPA: purine-nucleoside phosphorylase [Rhizomicrobium sp.]|nr:purine-nucleoside phosphorylase [Rhizomicrobium sp.]
MSQLSENIVENGAAAIRAYFGQDFPRTVLMLGSGFGGFAEKLEDASTLSYAAIPGFHSPTVMGHAGKLMVGTLAGQTLAVMAGRIHLFEGHAAQDIATMVRILRAAGAERLILTNASGGLSSDLVAGTLVIVEDHINFSGANPLIGPNDERIGPRFPDLTNAYDPELQALLARAAAETGVPVRSGVYVFVQGPSFETPAEIRTFNKLGGDIVGMSTVPECIAARQCGMKVAALSLVTNLAAGLSDAPLTHKDTLAEAQKAYGDMEKLLLRFFTFA